MTNDCLVTKLKGIVDNPSLEKLGVLNIELYDQGSLMFSQAQDVKLLNGIFNSTGNNVINISSNSRFYFTSDYCTLNSGETTYKVEVPKYHLTSVRRIAKETIDIDWLYKWSDSDYYEVNVVNHETQLSHLNDYNDKFGGEFVATGASVTPTEVWDVTHLGESRLLTRFYISSLSTGWITGSFDNLGNSPLTEIVFPNGLAENCSFNIESFVRKNVANGRTTYSISDLDYPGAVNTMFNGSLLTSDVTKNYSISWAPSATAGSTDIVLTDKSTGTSQTETITNVG